jgi:hemolysin III
MYFGERFNGSSHLVGLILALVGSAVLVVYAAEQQDIEKLVSFSIYGGSLVLMYAASTVYHSTRGRIKAFFRRLDHQAIYLLIAGTYTPFAVVSLRGAWGWTLLGIIWALALLGIVQEFLLGKRTRVLSLVIYLLMGWLALIVVVPLVEALSLSGFSWLLVGGVIYTAGVYFYCRDERVKHGHGIWHLFVLAGSSVHYFVIFGYLALPPGDAMLAAAG